eukprot:4682358-Pyramimonas_sp.AAC.1
MELPPLDDSSPAVALDNLILCFNMSSPCRANDIAAFTSSNIAKGMPVADLMLNAILAPPILHCFWGHALTSQPSFRATNKALNSAIW